MGLAEILSFCGFGTFFGGMAAFILQRAVKKRDQKMELERQMEARQAREMRERVAAVEAQNTATQLGVQALLRDRLLQAFKYYIAQGYADYDDRQNVLNMYQQYEALGPNSVMETYYSKFDALPFEL